MEQPRPRDIDYAALAVKAAILEKFGETGTANLDVTARDRTIVLADASLSVKHQSIEGTRDALLAAIRKAGQYEELWSLVPPTQTLRTGAALSRS